ncbi:MAG: shikimate dehydrogenase [Flavobacteriales bacterium]|jgi:shikimate dehydrogenase
MNNSDRYVVVGNPIQQSKSPIIHREFADQCKQDIQYGKIEFALGSFAVEARAFFDSGGKGMNITAPFKEDAYNFADSLSERAQAARAVNTLALMSDGNIVGDNTDGTGLVNDIVDRLHWPLTEQRILILGAGGAVRGILLPLLNSGVTEIVIANRTLEKAKSLSTHFSPFGSVTAIGFEQLADTASFDLIINGTSASLTGKGIDIPLAILKENTAFYDLVYSDEATPFMRDAAARGYKNIADGLGMLVGQAAESFRVWRGVMPDIDGVYSLLRP